MKRSRRHGRLAATLAIATPLLGGCALFGRDDTAAEPDPDLVARNLVHTVTPLVELNPLQTTVPVSEPATSFGERVLARLEDAGYGLQSVTDDQGSHYVRYSRDRSHSESGERLRYRVAIGPVAVERDFDTVVGQTVPRSVQVIDGTREQPVRVNDSGSTPTRSTA